MLSRRSYRSAYILVTAVNTGPDFHSGRDKQPRSPSSYSTLYLCLSHKCIHLANRCTTVIIVSMTPFASMYRWYSQTKPPHPPRPAKTLPRATIKPYQSQLDTV